MRIGAHVSTAGGVHTAIGRALDIGANCIQIFAGAPQRWATANFTAEDVAAFRRLANENDVRPTFIHSSYLLNFASADPDLREKSINSLRAALSWAQLLGADGVITHLGSSKQADMQEAERIVCQALSIVLERAPAEPMLLLESCAGQGNTIGRQFGQLGKILRTLRDPRVQICLDTAHVFEAGYDISTPAGLEQTLGQFDGEIGIPHLRVFHVNDSKTALGSNVDRHENIGHGLIGEAAFSRILQHPVLRSLPFVLEVPGLDKQGPDRPNIETMRRLAEVGNA